MMAPEVSELMCIVFISTLTVCSHARTGQRQFSILVFTPYKLVAYSSTFLCIGRQWGCFDETEKRTLKRKKVNWELTPQTGRSDKPKKNKTIFFDWHVCFSGYNNALPLFYFVMHNVHAYMFVLPSYASLRPTASVAHQTLHFNHCWWMFIIFCVEWSVSFF